MRALQRDVASHQTSELFDKREPKAFATMLGEGLA